MSLTVAIPVFNESNIIKETLRKLCIELESSLIFDTFEILVINDGSTDNTAELVAMSTGFGEKIKLVSHSTNLGRGKAVKTAMENFNGDVLVIIDADLSYSTKTIIDLAKPVFLDEADLTLASPYSTGGKVENIPFSRKVISRVGNRILKNAFKSARVTSTSIARGYSRDLVKSLNLIGYGKELNLEVIYKAELLGFRIRDVPAVLAWPDTRKTRQKKGGVKDLFLMAPIIRSHLLFQFISRPTVLFGIPILISFTIFLYGILNLFFSIVSRINEGIENPVRETLVEGSLTLAITAFSFITGLLFIVIFFLVVQSKLYFEELFIFLTRIFKDLKSRD